MGGFTGAMHGFLLKRIRPCVYSSIMVPRGGGRDQPMVAFAVGFLLRFSCDPGPATHMMPAWNSCGQLGIDRRTCEGLMKIQRHYFDANWDSRILRMPQFAGCDGAADDLPP